MGNFSSCSTRYAGSMLSAAQTTGDYLKNRNLLGLLSDLFVIWNGTVPFLSDMRHFQVIVDTSLRSEGHETRRHEGAAVHTCSVLYLRRSAFS